MKTSLLPLFLLLHLAIPSRAQELFNLSGSVHACYDSNDNEAIPDMSMKLILRSVDNKREFFATVNSKGDFSLKGLPADSYKLMISALGLPEYDSAIIVNQNLHNLFLCIDRAYRPAPIDSINMYKQKAVSDIENGKAKIYEWTPWSITKDPFEKLNPKLKKKYGFEYQMMSCVRQQTRDEIVQVQLWQAYNEVVYEHLADLHGRNWRKGIKYERKKLQENKNQ